MISEQVKVEEKNIDSFINSLKNNVVKTKKKVECLICEGDGLGIQKKIDY